MDALSSCCETVAQRDLVYGILTSRPTVSRTRQAHPSLRSVFGNNTDGIWYWDGGYGWCSKQNIPTKAEDDDEA